MWVEFRNAYADRVINDELVMGDQVSVNTERIVFVRAKQKASNALTDRGQPDLCILGLDGAMEDDEQRLMVHGTHDEVMAKINGPMP